MTENITPHHNWMDLSRAAERWGKTIDKSAREAVADVTTEQLMLGALLRIAKLADLALPITEAANKLCDEIIAAMGDQWLDNYFRQVQETFECGMAEREEKHGDCPQSLKDDLRREADNNAAYRIGAAMKWKFAGHASITPPAKGSPTRLIYDRWMRRKRPTKPEATT